MVFYGVYYGVLGRDCAELCVDFMSASMTVRDLILCIWSINEVQFPNKFGTKGANCLLIYM